MSNPPSYIYVMRKNKDEIVVETMINKMFEIAGHSVTFEDIKDRKDDWYVQWTMTEEQNKEWRDWGSKYLKKQKGLRKHYAERQIAMFDLMYGLKLQQNDKMETQTNG